MGSGDGRERTRIFGDVGGAGSVTDDLGSLSIEADLSTIRGLA